MGALFLLVLACLTGAHIWLDRGSFVPILHRDGIEYLLISQSFADFLLVTLAVFVIVLVGHLVLERMVSSENVTRLLSFQRVRYLWPLGLSGLSLFSLFNLLPAFEGRLGAFSYFIVDLQWWWRVLIAVVVFRAIDRRVDGALSRRLQSAVASMSRSPQRAGAGVILAILVTIYAVVSTPQLRFSALLHGDEPKYVRYCENLYQGCGFEISRKRLISDLPLEYSPQLIDNVHLLLTASREEAQNLWIDILAILRGEPPERFNRAKPLAERFLLGKNGGLYQAHSPGLSFLLLPAYFIDRHYLSEEAESSHEFPTRLWVVNTACLGFYALFAVTVLRFLRRSTQNDRLAWWLTLTVMLTLPVAAFSFQIYPEVAGGVFIFVLATYVLFMTAHSTGGTFGYGVLAGYLPWLHLKFLGVSLVIVLWRLAVVRGDRRKLAAFAVGYALPVVCLMLFAYRVTGSLLPDAAFRTTMIGESAFDLTKARGGLLGYVVDRNWGLLPYSPVFLLAAMGIWPLSRTQPRMTVFLALVVLALAIPTAGHDLSGASTTPLRHLVAVLPFAAVPLAQTLRRWRASPAFLGMFVVLLIISLDNALTYNRHHIKGEAVGAWSFSGWKMGQIFPWVRGTDWSTSPRELILLIGWLALCASLIGLGFRAINGPRPKGGLESGHPRPFGEPVLVAAAMIAIAGTVVAVMGAGWHPRYLLPAREARLQAISTLASLEQCAICYSSRRGEVSLGTAVENSLTSLSITPRPASAAVGESIAMAIEASGSAGEPTWGTFQVDFGDGEHLRGGPIVGRGQAQHRYRQPGIYKVSLYFNAPGSKRSAQHAEVRIY